MQWSEKSLPMGRLAIRLLILFSTTKASLREGKKERKEKQACIHHILIFIVYVTDLYPTGQSFPLLAFHFIGSRPHWARVYVIFVN
ncbi:hypothetical protein [Photorhabdus hainanensis]|uniref:hypothetical protein n=1 Tax=Photorhabdus hainanensis TaxID=1004166 RepID=UPI001BD66393|nr:hypothetical protein [Photorhabdus hainanensis]